MAFIDEFKKNAAEVAEKAKKSAVEVADKAKKKTTEITNLAKINLNIKSNEAKLAAVYEEIGRLFYNAERQGEDNTAEIAESIIKADQLVADIAEGKKELAKLRNVRVCTECGAEIDISFAFCNFCGAKQEVIFEEESVKEETDDEEIEIAIEEEPADEE